MNEIRKNKILVDEGLSKINVLSDKLRSIFDDIESEYTECLINEQCEELFIPDIPSLTRIREYVSRCLKYNQDIQSFFKKQLSEVDAEINNDIIDYSSLKKRLNTLQNSFEDNRSVNIPQINLKPEPIAPDKEVFETKLKDLVDKKYSIFVILYILSALIFCGLLSLVCGAYIPGTVILIAGALVSLVLIIILLKEFSKIKKQNNDKYIKSLEQFNHDHNDWKEETERQTKLYDAAMEVARDDAREKNLIIENVLIEINDFEIKFDNFHKDTINKLKNFKNDFINELKQYFPELRYLYLDKTHDGDYNLSRTYDVLKYIGNGRANNLKEAIEAYELDTHREYLEDKAYDAALAAEMAEDYQREAAENSAKMADYAEMAAKDAARSASLQKDALDKAERAEKLSREARDSALRTEELLKKK